MSLEVVENLREHHRVLVNKEVRVDSSKNRGIDILLLDVSLGGARLAWPEKCEDAQITVHFSTDLYFDAEIRWCKKVEDHYEIGVKFLDLDEVAAIYFGEYIQLLEEE